jgi:hypothetical protein
MNAGVLFGYDWKNGVRPTLLAKLRSIYSALSTGSGAKHSWVPTVTSSKSILFV